MQNSRVSTGVLIEHIDYWGVSHISPMNTTHPTQKKTPPPPTSAPSWRLPCYISDRPMLPAQPTVFMKSISFSRTAFGTQQRSRNDAKESKAEKVGWQKIHYMGIPHVTGEYHQFTLDMDKNVGKYTNPNPL